LKWDWETKEKWNRNGVGFYYIISTTVLTKSEQIYEKVINSKISNDMDMLAEKLNGMEGKFV
jgi:hypothetical protein